VAAERARDRDARRRTTALSTEPVGSEADPAGGSAGSAAAASARAPAQELGLHHDLQLRVERAERLVGEDRLRPVDQRARERDALAHAARQLARGGALEAAQPDELDHPRRPLGDLRAREAAQRER